jgi:hypothetical protein
MYQKVYELLATRIRGLAVLFLVLYLLPLSVILWYSLPMMDDFWYAIKTFEHGFWGAQKEWYMSWTGRVGGTFLISLATLALERFYGLVMFFNFAFLCGAIYYLLSACIHPEKQRKLIVYYAFLLSISVMSLPSIDEGLLSLSPAGNYTFPISLTFLFLGLELRKSPFSMLKLFLLFLMGIFNEFYTITSIIFTLTLSGYSPTLQKQLPPKKIIIYCAILLIGLGIMVLSPGIALRKDFPYRPENSGSILKALLYASYYLLDFIGRNIITIPTLAFGVVFTMLPKSKRLLHYCQQIDARYLLFAYVFCLVFNATYHVYILGTLVSGGGTNVLFLLSWLVVAILIAKYQDTLSAYLNQQRIRWLSPLLFSLLLVHPTFLLTVSSILYSSSNVITFSEFIQADRDQLKQKVLDGQKNPKQQPVPLDMIPGVYYFPEVEPVYLQTENKIKYYQLKYGKR